MTQNIESVTVNSVVDREQVSQKVDRAVELNRLIEAHSDELTKLKAEIREAAKTGVFPRSETGTVEIRSLYTENCAQVCYPKDTPAIIKGVDVEPVVAQLTVSTFDLLFRRVVVMQPSEKFEQSFKVLPKNLQRLVKKVVAWAPNTPQVKLSK